MIARAVVLLLWMLCLQGAERWIPFGVEAKEPVTLYGGIVDVAGFAGGHLVLRSDGSVSAWGIGTDNHAVLPPDVAAISTCGEQGAVITRSGSVHMLRGPDPVPPISSAVQIAVGFNKHLALLSDGTVVTWRSSDGFSSPVSGVDHIVWIASGQSGSVVGEYDYAVRADGTVLRWDALRTVTAFPGLSNVSKMLASGDIALHTDGSITSYASDVPSGLTQIVDAVQLYGGHVLLKSTGELLVYGGVGSLNAWLPQNIGKVAKIAGPSLIALRQDGTVVAWGLNSTWGGQDTVPEGLPESAHLVSGYGYHAGCIGIDGSLRLWGPNEFGQTDLPVGLGTVQCAQTGMGFTVALETDGSVHAWGDGRLGQTAVPGGIGPAMAIATGYKFGSALRATGEVVGWGDGLASVVPVSLANVTALAAGSHHALALRADGTVVAWGRNDEGQCNVPGGLDSVVSISAGFAFSVARRSDGSVVLWGQAPPSGNMLNAGRYFDLASHAKGGIALRPDGIDIFYDIPVYPHMVTLPEGLGPASRAACMGNGVYVRAEPIECSIALSSTSVLYDGRPHCLLATPSVPGVMCNWTYDGSRDFPSAVGTHAAVASVDAWAYKGSATATLRIVYVMEPTVSIVSFTNDTTPTWIWSGNGGGIGAYRYALDDPALLSPTSTTDSSFTAPVLPQGSHTLYVQECDASGHWSDAGHATVNVDTEAPTVSLFASAASVDQGGRFTVDAVFSEAVTAFDLDRFACRGATLLGVSAAGDGRTFTAEFMAGPPGSALMSVSAGAAHDLAGNANQVSSEITVAISAVPAGQPSEGVPGNASGTCGGGLTGLLFALGAICLTRRRRLLP